MPTQRKNWKSTAMLLSLVMLLTGCGTKLQLSEMICPTLPQKPAVSEPTPSQAYSVSASENIERWRKVLIDMSQTNKP